MEEKRIKSYFEFGEKLGVAHQVEGQVVTAIKLPSTHPVFPNMWEFEFRGEKWIASDWAFKN